MVGTVQAFALACGFLFVALYRGFLAGTSALLFGSFLGITTARSSLLAVVAVAVLAVLAVLGRPLLFASRRPRRGPRPRRAGPRLLGHGLPAAARRRRGRGQPDHRRAAGLRAAGAAGRRPRSALTARPARRPRPRRRCSRLVTVWVALIVAYYSPYPVGFWLTSLAFGLLRRWPRRAAAVAGRRPAAASAAAAPARHGPVRAVAPATRATCSPTRSCSTRSWPAPPSPSPAGLVGYFLVLRGQVFTGDALTHVAFTGALAALAAGLDLRLGLFAPPSPSRSAWACSAAAAGPTTSSSAACSPGSSASACSSSPLHHQPQRHRQRRGRRHRAVRVHLRPVRRRGTRHRRRRRSRSCAGAARHRPAAAVRQPRRGGRRRPRRAGAAARASASSPWSGVTAAEATQVVGALLHPRAARRARRRRRTGSPPGRCARSRCPPRIAVGAVWVGLTASYAVPRLPPSFAILAVATGVYALALALPALRERRRRRPAGPPATATAWG